MRTLLLVPPLVCLPACAGDSSSSNLPPVFEESAPLSVLEGERLEFIPVVHDPDGDTLKLIYSGWSVLPSRIAGEVGGFSWTVTAKDGNGGVASQTVPVEVLADPSPDRASFALAAEDTEALPFPNDLWTVADASQATDLRIDLPLPPLGEFSEHHLVAALNELDGFSTRPRIVVPTEGAVPGAATFGEQSLFLVALSPPERGTVLSVDQRVLDQGFGPHAVHRLIATPEKTLQESSRYALVLTRDLLVAGEPIRRKTALNELLYRWESAQPAATPLENDLYDALDALAEAGIAEPDAIATLATFTTRTLSTLPLALRERLDDGDFPLDPLSFNTDPSRPGLETWDADDVDTIVQYQHRASALATGPTISFPDLSLELSPLGDQPDDVWLEHVSTGALLHVPPADVTAFGGVQSTDITPFQPFPGDEIALLARGVEYNGILPPYRFKSVGRIAFWRADVPIYTDADAEIPLVLGGAPPQTGVETLIGILCLPDAPKPAGGFPVADYAHGHGGTAFDDALFFLAGPLADAGIATLAFNASGHGGGPRSFLEITAAGGADVAILRASGLGRSKDLNGDDQYASSEGLNILQRWSDIMAVVRSAHLGADADGLGGSDLTAQPASTYQFGISYGGQTTLGIATYDTEVGVCVANVPGMGHFGNGYLTALGASRDSAGALLATWLPASLLNGPDPQWGGGFTEDVPWPGEPVQIGLVPGAEEIQWALDAQQWRDAHQMAAAIMPLTANGEARGGTPMPLLLQLSRGDGVAANTLQYHLIKSGELEDRACLVQFDLEPSFDSLWGLFGFAPGAARHSALALPHTGDPLNLAGRLSDDLRQQLVDFLASGGGVFGDPDAEADSPYTGDVFEVPISAASLLELASDPAFP